jgi:uncharacterized protein (TIGR02246 family)
MYRVFLLATLISVSASCEPSNGQPAESGHPIPETGAVEPQVSNTVNELVRGFWDAWASAEVDLGIAYFAEDATAITKMGAILRGRERIDAAWRPGFESIAGQVIEFTDSFISVYGSDLASVHQIGTFLIQFTDGTTEGPIPFTYTTVWKLRDNEWRIIVAHRTDPPEPTG